MQSIQPGLHYFRHQNGRVNTLARLNERRVGPCAQRFRWPIKFSAVSIRFIAHIARGHNRLFAQAHRAHVIGGRTFLGLRLSDKRHYAR